MRLSCGVALLLLVSGCDTTRERLDPGYSEPMINGWLYRVEYYDGSVDYDTDVEVWDNDGLRMVPVVELNGGTLNPYYYHFTQYRYGHSAPFPVHEPYELNVTHYWGEAFSRVVMPGNFCLTSPDTNYVMDMESTLVLTWEPSPGAQWYWLDLYCDYDFLDTFGFWDDYSYNLDTIIGDTFIVVPPGWVFPGYVGDVLEGDGAVLVWAGYGPRIEPGDVGNVRGAGFGFFNAVNEPRERYFWVGSPWKDIHYPRLPQSRDKLLAYLRGRGRADFR